MNRSRTTSPGRLTTTRGGFTMIEMLVVVSIVGVLVSMLVPSLSTARESARRTTCVAHLKHVGAATFTYAFVSRDWGPKVMNRAGTTAPRSLLSRSGKFVNLGMLLERELSGHSDVFYCPSQRAYSYSSNPEYLPQATVSGSYAYAVHIAADKSPRLGAARHLALMSDDFVARLGSHEGVGKSSHRTGYNVLYTDGSASFYSDPAERIWRQAVHWDDETDDVTYYTLYDGGAEVPDDAYGNDLDIFRVWRAFCYNRPVRFTE